jgi:hypothetical protein
MLFHLSLWHRIVIAWCTKLLPNKETEVGTDYVGENAVVAA